MTLLVEHAALLMTVQDQGRNGFQRFGLPESGPMDWWAHRAANRLVANQPGDACVEIGFSDAVLQLESDALLAVCGGGYHLRINERQLPLWMAFRGRSGDRVHLDKVPGGNWAYLAVAGGLLTPDWFGSRSVYPRAGLGQPLADGDRLPVSSSQANKWLLAGQSLPEETRPDYQNNPVLRVIPGPHLDRFQQASFQSLWETPFTLSPHSDRMGYRLTGPGLAHQDGADLISQGMVQGEIQVPGDGQLIIMMPDHPTTGGYTCIGTVIRCDLPLLAQAEPGVSQIRFQPVEVPDAQDLLRTTIAKFDTGFQSQEDLWLHL